MAANGNARAALAPGHFLFTSESVGEGHPGQFHRQSVFCNESDL
jgi:hypothetical protein